MVEEAGWCEREGMEVDSTLGAENAGLGCMQSRSQGGESHTRKVVGKEKQEINSCIMEEKERDLKRERES